MRGYTQLRNLGFSDVFRERINHVKKKGMLKKNNSKIDTKRNVTANYS